MSITRFDHINVLTSDISAMRDFFAAVLGLVEGPRPPFRSPGYWMYHGENALIHISDTARHEQTHVEDIGHIQTSGKHGAVDHIAFRCHGYDATKTRLRELGIACHEADVPALADRQVFVDGPDSLTLELIFSPSEVATDRALVGGGAA